MIAPFVRRGFTPRIDARLHQNAVAALEPVTINGGSQWVLMRSEDVAQPVVLFVHGGPGTSMLSLLRSCLQPLESRFIVVNWDQRGAGKSFAAARDRARMTMGQFVDDIIALATYLAQRFHKRDVLLVGHSWGSAIGLLAVAKRPELFCAYVGIGQFCHGVQGERLSYEWTLARAREAGNRSDSVRLVNNGPPPYTGTDWRAKFLTQRRLLAKYGGELHGNSKGASMALLRNLLFSCEYTWLDRLNLVRGSMQSLELLFPELLATDLFVQVPAVQVPVYFCLGRHDYEVPSQLSARYFETLAAPRKQLVWFERSAHLPFLEEPSRFEDFMLHTVRPAVEPPPAG